MTFFPNIEKRVQIHVEIVFVKTFETAVVYHNPSASEDILKKFEEIAERSVDYVRQNWVIYFESYFF